MKQLKYFLILGLIISLPSCFELIEEVDMNEDGSGRYQIILNLSQSKSNINGLMLLDEVNGYKIPSHQRIIQAKNNISDSIRRMNGVSKLKVELDSINYILDLSFNFDKVERINETVNKIIKSYFNENDAKASYYRYRNQNFYRTPGALTGLLYQKIKSSDRNVLDNASYTSVYRFKKEVDNMTNTLAKVSPNKKVVFLHAPMQKMIMNPKLFKNYIKLKP